MDHPIKCSACGSEDVRVTCFDCEGKNYEKIRSQHDKDREIEREAKQAIVKGIKAIEVIERILQQDILVDSCIDEDGAPFVTGDIRLWGAELSAHATTPEEMAQKLKKELVDYLRDVARQIEEEME